MRKLTFLTIIMSIVVSFTTCKGRNAKKDSGAIKSDDSLTIVKDSVNNQNNEKRLYFYIENSGSMFGYVKGYTEYVDVVSELAAKSEFVDKGIVREFYFVNGHNPLSINHLGNSKENGNVLIDKLNNSAKGYKQGNDDTSDLNAMFQLAMDKAQGSNISILISDGLYDIREKNAPYNALITEGRNTREKYINRLNKSDLETILIKFQSQFEGKYYYITRFNQDGKQEYKTINQKRPFYVWVFGKSELLNEYFSDDYISSLRGYQNLVRFLKIDKFNIPYKITAKNRIGRFDFDRDNKFRITNVQMDKRKKQFQFSFNVDFSELPLPDSYFSNPLNYKSSGKYHIQKIVPLNEINDGKSAFTHQITVMTEDSPYGKLEISLKNLLPSWIEKTNTDTETDVIEPDKTFGFKILTEGISDAYAYKNDNKYITTFKFTLTN